MGNHSRDADHDMDIKERPKLSPVQTLLEKWNKDIEHRRSFLASDVSRDIADVMEEMRNELLAALKEEG